MRLKNAYYRLMNTEDGDTFAPVVLEELRALLRELHPDSTDEESLSLNSRLDRDLGLDSLSRVELMDRIEKRVHKRLPDEILASAESPADLVEALVLGDSYDPQARRSSSSEKVITDGDTSHPSEATTLIQMLEYHAHRKKNAAHIWLYDEQGEVETISYQDILKGAAAVARGLRKEGVEEGQAVSIMLPTSRNFLDAFFGVLLAGAVPVPMYPPVRPSQIEEHLRRQAVILETARVPVMITVPEARKLGQFLQAKVECLRRLVTTEELAQEGESETGSFPLLHGRQTAFLQFTSGSTGNPKGVVLSHANLLANVRAIVVGCELKPNDVFVSWLPLYHDLGLIGALLGTLYAGMPLVLMSPLRFLRRPERWLQAISEHKGTISAAPNFAYELCIRKVPEELLGQLDLSSWRLSMNGAEPVVPGTLERFAEKFGPCGYRPEVMQPVYGLAESSVGVTSPRPGIAPTIDRVLRSALVTQKRAEPADAETKESDVLEFVGCGAPLVGHELRVVDDSGRELPDRREGRIHFRGPSSTVGYFENPEATALLKVGDGWLDSGDLGYVADGEVFITGRKKDVIIRGGRNIYPHELEEAVGNIPLIRKGCVAVFAAKDASGGTEKVVVLAEVRHKKELQNTDLKKQIYQVSTDVLGSPADDVVLVAPQTVLKTSSGKLRRNACRNRYELGLLGKPSAALWIQMARLGFETIYLRAVQAAVWLKDLGFSIRFGLVFAGGLLLWMGLVLLTPSIGTWHWRVNRGITRWVLWLAGVSVQVEGKEYMKPISPAIYVSNHTSYLDSLILPAVLPVGTRFMVKRELKDVFLLGRALQKMGALFVERQESGSKKAALGEKQLREALEEGHSVVVYAEGTCLRMPGLLPFKMGAFLAASRVGAPVVPVTLRGVRQLLRPSTFLPKKSSVQVTIGEPLGPEGAGFEAAANLRNRVRKVILETCGEPDRGKEDIGRFFS